jgi:hypothetical protein
LLLPDTELLSVPDEEDEDDLDESSFFDDEESTPFNPLQRPSNFSIVTPNKSRSRSYKFIQLEHALTLAGLLTDKDDRLKFQHAYRDALRDNKFGEFSKTYYQILRDHQDKLKQERMIKRTRTFKFVDLEKNFLALDPTRDIKVVFIDDSTTPKLIKDIHRNSTVSIVSEDDTIEEFYKSRSRHLLRNPSRARDEITLFARHSSERLQERLPHLSSVPHRVKIIDQRETKVVHDERTLLQMKHKHALSLIAKRRQMVLKMMVQANKNQTKMKKLNFQSPLTMDNPSCCRELLDKINQIESIVKEERYIKRPQTGFVSQRTVSKTTDYSSNPTTSSLTQSYSSSSTLFQNAFSMHDMGQTNNVQVIQSKRPLTAPIQKATWVNYC